MYYPSWWIIVKVDEEICRYYRKLIQFYSPTLRLNGSKDGAHITVIAGKYERPDESHAKFWGRYEGETIDFQFNPEINSDGEYYWMEVECNRIEDIREELGLKRTILHPWHLTVGNTK